MEICPECSGDFVQARRDQKYCAPSCRTRFWMKNNKKKRRRYMIGWQKEYRRTPYGFIGNIVDRQHGKSKDRGWPLPQWTAEELYVHAMKNEKFLRLFSDWIKSGYQKKLSPSVDRIDFEKYYSWDNIQFVTTEYNCYVKGRFEHRGYKLNKPVIQVCKKSGKDLNRFESITQAAKTLSVRGGNICQVASGKRKTAYGFKWRYEHAHDNS